MGLGSRFFFITSDRLSVSPPALHTPRTEQHIPIARGLGVAAKAASCLTAPCAWTFFSPAQSAPRAGTSAPWAGTSTRYYANSSPASKETACAAPLCTPPPAARPRPWPGRCRPQYYECEWGRQQRAPTSLAPPASSAPQCGSAGDRDCLIEHLKCSLSIAVKAQSRALDYPNVLMRANPRRRNRRAAAVVDHENMNGIDA